MSLDVQSISLDISKQPTPQQVRLGQGDANATQLIVSVFDDGETYSLDDYTVRLAMRLPNDGGYYNVNGTKSGNVATFDIDEQYAASVCGFDGFGYVDIMDGETVICSTSRFQLVVLQNASDGVELAPQYIDAVQDAIDRANAAAEAAEGVVLQDVPTMSATIKGGAKLGNGLSVASDTLSLSGESFTTAEKTKLAGIEDGANNYELPTMDASTKGGAKLGAGLSVSNDVLSVDASSIATGALPVAHGGTGNTTNTANAVLTGNGTSAVNNVATADGALYATTANGAASFGTLPIAQGGTGATSAAGARTNLGVALPPIVRDVELGSITLAAGAYGYKSATADTVSGYTAVGTLGAKWTHPGSVSCTPYSNGTSVFVHMKNDSNQSMTEDPIIVYMLYLPS